MRAGHHLSDLAYAIALRIAVLFYPIEFHFVTDNEHSLSEQMVSLSYKLSLYIQCSSSVAQPIHCVASTSLSICTGRRDHCEGGRMHSERGGSFWRASLSIWMCLLLGETYILNVLSLEYAQKTFPANHQHTLQLCPNKTNQKTVGILKC